MTVQYLLANMYWNLRWRISGPYSEWVYLSCGHWGPEIKLVSFIDIGKVQFLAIAIFPPLGVRMYQMITDSTL